LIGRNAVFIAMKKYSNALIDFATGTLQHNSILL
jgi:hypothetical protein